MPKSLAKRFNEIKDGKLQSDLIIGYIEEVKKDLKVNIECMDEDVLIFRGIMAKAKQAFKDVKDTELKSFYELWEKFESDKKKTKEFVTEAIKELRPLRDELESIKSLMNSIDKWGIENLLSVIEKLGNSLHGETKEMVKFLFDNYKKEVENEN